MRVLPGFLALFCGVQLAAATDTYRESWHWSTAVPSSFAASSHPLPTAAAFKQFHFGPHASVKQIVATFGRPIGFARQYPVTRTEGVPIERLSGFSSEAGTFHYMLQDGGDAFVCVQDLRTVTAVLLFSRRGAQDTVYTQKDDAR